MRTWIDRHPNLTTWAVLAVGMLVVLAWSARDVALAAAQRLWLGAATVLLAGLCAWIISWEADDDFGDEVLEGSALNEEVESEAPVASPVETRAGSGGEDAADQAPRALDD